MACEHGTLLCVNNYRYYLIIASATCLALISALAFGLYRYVELDQEADALAKAQVEADTYIKELTRQLTDAERERSTLSDALVRERAKTGSFEQQISEISGTVGTLTKLATTDPELLAKYSKVYFLNENYTPSELSIIDPALSIDPTRTLELHAKVYPYLEEMIEDAKDDDIEIRVASAYRSFGTQGALKNGYVVNYGAGANRFSADQGYSEHQLGTTVDLTTPALGGAFTGFASTEAYAWLGRHAHRYGFILSYPKGNTYYMYEPWHWRYVGVELATKLHRDEAQFYDLDQREITTYLASLFD